jgi:hypothetical protein
MSHDEALSLFNEWKLTGANLAASGTNADGSAISLPGASIKFASTHSLTFRNGNKEIQFDLSLARFGKTEGIPRHLLRVLITSVSIAFPNGAALAICELIS